MEIFVEYTHETLINWYREFLGKAEMNESKAYWFTEISDFLVRSQEFPTHMVVYSPEFMKKIQEVVKDCHEKSMTDYLSQSAASFSFFVKFLRTHLFCLEQQIIKADEVFLEVLAGQVSLPSPTRHYPAA
jgi:hypothetical protein